MGGGIETGTKQQAAIAAETMYWQEVAAADETSMHTYNKKSRGVHKFSHNCSQHSERPPVSWDLTLTRPYNKTGGLRDKS